MTKHLTGNEVSGPLHINSASTADNSKESWIPENYELIKKQRYELFTKEPKNHKTGMRVTGKEKCLLGSHCSGRLGEYLKGHKDGWIQKNNSHHNTARPHGIVYCLSIWCNTVTARRTTIIIFNFNVLPHFYLRCMIIYSQFHQRNVILHITFVIYTSFKATHIFIQGP